MERPSAVDVPAGRVSVVWNGSRAAQLLLVLAPGAGADLHSDFMTFFAEGAADRGLQVCRFNFVYQEAGRRSPDRAPVLEETYRVVVERVAAGHDGALFVGGKSLGGRIASHLVAQGLAASGLVCLGYPLHPPGRPEKLRDAHLYDIEIPMLFVEGTRDPFCPLDTLEGVKARIAAPLEVFEVADGDHSFKVRKSSGRSTTEAWNEAVDAVARWTNKVAAGRE